VRVGGVGGGGGAPAPPPYNRVHPWNGKTLFLALYDRYLIRPYPDGRLYLIVFFTAFAMQHHPTPFTSNHIDVSLLKHILI